VVFTAIFSTKILKRLTQVRLRSFSKKDKSYLVLLNKGRHRNDIEVIAMTLATICRAMRERDQRDEGNDIKFGVEQ
jgi:hypothetical protein